MSRIIPPVVLPVAPVDRVLARVGAIWSPKVAPHHLIYASTGAGKSSLIKMLAWLRPKARLLLVTPKPNPDPVYEGFARPVLDLQPGFGCDYEGGGPHGLWFEIFGQRDQHAGKNSGTARRIGQALEIVASEGHTVLVVDDARFVCKHLGLGDVVDRITGMSRSDATSVILSTTELAYVAGRQQGSMTWVGFTGGSLAPAKAAAGLLGLRGAANEETCAAVRRHEWIYQDHEAGNAGPCLTRPTLADVIRCTQ